MKKVLLVTRPICPPWDEASKNFAYTLARTINDFEITLLTSGVVPNVGDNVRQKSIYTSGNFSFMQKMRLVKHLKKMRRDYDIIHYAFTPTAFNSFMIQKFLGAGNGAKTIQTIATLREDLFSEKEIKAMLFADMIATYSVHAKEKLEMMGFKNVRHIYPGIDLENFQPAEKNPSLLKKYNFKKEDFIINFTGEYTRLGAIDDVIESFKLVSDEIEEARLSLAVRIKNKKDAQKKGEIIEKLKEYNLLDKVSFHDSGFYNMADIYNLCDISLFPVRDMNGKFDIPLAVIEAMACEKPVIISDIPILREFATNDNSVVIKPGDLDGLVRNIISLHDNKDLRESIGKQARSYVDTMFDIHSAALKYSELYSEMLN